MMVSRGDRNFGGLWGVLEARGPVPLGSGEFLAGLAKNNNTHTHEHAISQRQESLSSFVAAHKVGEGWPHAGSCCWPGLLCNPPCVTSSFRSRYLESTRGEPDFRASTALGTITGGHVCFSLLQVGDSRVTK